MEKYLGPKGNSSKTAQKAIILRTFGVQVYMAFQTCDLFRRRNHPESEVLLCGWFEAGLNDRKSASAIPI